MILSRKPGVVFFAPAETPFEKAFKDESEKCYMHMMKKVQIK